MEIDNVTQALYYGATEQPSIPQFTEQSCKAKVKKIKCIWMWGAESPFFWIDMYK